MNQVSSRPSLLHFIIMKSVSAFVARQLFLVANALISPFVVVILRHVPPSHAMQFHAMQWGILDSTVPMTHLACRRQRKCMHVIILLTFVAAVAAAAAAGGK